MRISEGEEGGKETDEIFEIIINVSILMSDIKPQTRNLREHQTINAAGVVVAVSRRRRIKSYVRNIIFKLQKKSKVRKKA